MISWGKRGNKMVEGAGFKPAISGLWARRAIRLLYHTTGTSVSQRYGTISQIRAKKCLKLPIFDLLGEVSVDTCLFIMEAGFESLHPSLPYM